MPMTNRTLYATAYHQHSGDGESEAYTLIRSSMGNEEIYKQNKKGTGKDMEADLVLSWMHFTPSDRGCRV